MTPLERYVEPAKARDGFWRVIVGTILIGFVGFAGSVFVFVVAEIVMGVADPAISLGEETGTIVPGDTPSGIIVLIASLSSIWLGVWAVGRFLHRQPFGTFFAPDRRYHANLFLKGFLFGAIFYTFSTALGFVLAQDVRRGLEFDQWAYIFIPIVAAIFFQATAEELFFRGYLLQQLARRWRHWLIWAVLPSIGFGLLHFDETLPDGGYYTILAAFLAGLLFCALVWRSGSLWPAIGVHMAMNIIAFTIIGSEATYSSTQLWVTGEADYVKLGLADIATLFIMLVIVISPTGRFFAPDQSATATNHKSGNGDAF